MEILAWICWSLSMTILILAGLAGYKLINIRISGTLKNISVLILGWFFWLVSFVSEWICFNLLLEKNLRDFYGIMLFVCMPLFFACIVFLLDYAWLKN